MMRRLSHAMSCLILGLIILEAGVRAQRTFSSRTIVQTTSVVGNGPETSAQSASACVEA